MALKTSKFSEVPLGEQPLTKSEAVAFQWDIMETLCPPYKRKFLRYGYGLMSFVASLNCIYLHGYYRKALNVIFEGRMASFFPGVFLPCLANMFLHKMFITNNILVQKWDCPYCYHIKSGLINVVCGSIYPAIVSPIIAISYARRIKLDVPPINSKRVVKFLYEKTKPVGRKMAIVACIQFLIGVAVAEVEVKENNDFNENINKYIMIYQRKMAREGVAFERINQESPKN